MWAQTSRSLRRVLASAAADHLRQAAVLLRDPPSIDALLLGAVGTAEVIDALGADARRLGTTLPAELTASLAWLRRGAAALKHATPRRAGQHPLATSPDLALPEPATVTPTTPDPDRRNGQHATQPRAAYREPVSEQVGWHLAEATADLREAPTPLDRALLGVVLRGLADLCGLVHERARETPADPTALFRNDPVVAEALSMWARRVEDLTDHAHPDGPGCP